MKTQGLKSLFFVLFCLYVLWSHGYRLFDEYDLTFRETQTAMITRNFITKDFHPLLPRVDFNGPGDVHMILEFPLYNMMVAGLYRIGGIHVGFGKVLSLLFFVGSCVYLFLLARCMVPQRTALLAVALYTVLPVIQYYGQAFMPDMMLYCLLFGFMYHAMVSFETSRIAHLIAMAILAVLTVLLKMTPVLIFACTFLWGFFQIRRRPSGWGTPVAIAVATGIIAVVLLGLWYQYTRGVHDQYFPYFSSEAFTRFNFGTLSDRFSFDFYWTLVKKTARFLTPPFILLALLGWIIARVKRHNVSFLEWYTATAVLSYLIFWRTSVQNEHYLMIFALPVALFSSIALVFIWDEWMPLRDRRQARYRWVFISALVLTFVYNITMNIGLAQRPSLSYHKVQLEAALAAGKQVPKGDLVFYVPGTPISVTSWNDPTFFYYSERVGKNISSLERLNNLRASDEFSEYHWVVVTFGEFEDFQIRNKQQVLSELAWTPAIRAEDKHYLIIEL